MAKVEVQTSCCQHSYTCAKDEQPDAVGCYNNPVTEGKTNPNQTRQSASFPVPHPAFRRLQYGKQGGPGTFPHVSDVKGRKTVERPKMSEGILGLRTARRAKIRGNIRTTCS